MKTCPSCGNPLEENQAICLNCGHVVGVDDESDKNDFGIYTDYLNEIETDKDNPNEVNFEEDKSNEFVFSSDESNEFDFDSILNEEPVEERIEETPEEAVDEDDGPSFKVIKEDSSGEVQKSETVIDEPVFETVKEPVFETVAEESVPEEKAESVISEVEEVIIPQVEEPVAEETTETEKYVFDAVNEPAVTDDISFNTADESNLFSIDETVFDSVETPSFETVDEPSFEEFEEPVAEPQVEESAEELSMVERIRKYQIIPDSQPIDDDVFIAAAPKIEYSESVQEIYDTPEEAEIKPKKGKTVKPKKEKAVKPIKVAKRRKRINKKLIKLIIAALVITAIAVAAIIILTNKNIKDKVGSIFEKEPTEQTEVTDKLTLRWVGGKRYSSDFDVLKIDKEKLKDAIEDSLRKNCTSEYNKLNEHYFGTINGSDNYIGYVDNLGVGVLFELTDKDDLIKSICVLFDTSSDVNKGETLISEYTACVLNALGEIDELSYKNIGIYASSIKANSFKSVATYTRYNNFILKKIVEGNYSALIISHGSEATINKFAQNEVLDIVNCADEKFLKEELTEPTTEKVETTEFKEAVVYVVKTAGDPLRIRKGPNTDSEVLGTFESGTQIEVFGITDGWAKIMYNNEEAWLSANFLEEVKGE